MKNIKIMEVIDMELYWLEKLINILVKFLAADEDEIVYPFDEIVYKD